MKKNLCLTIFIGCMLQGGDSQLKSIAQKDPNGYSLKTFVSNLVNGKKSKKFNKGDYVTTQEIEEYHISEENFKVNLPNENSTAPQPVLFTMEKVYTGTSGSNRERIIAAGGTAGVLLAYWQRQRIYNAANYVTEKTMSVCKQVARFGGQVARFGGWVVSPFFGKAKTSA